VIPTPPSEIAWRNLEIAWLDRQIAWRNLEIAWLDRQIAWRNLEIARRNFAACAGRRRVAPT
jgi:hypothetical protein